MTLERVPRSRPRAWDVISCALSVRSIDLDWTGRDEHGGNTRSGLLLGRRLHRTGKQSVVEAMMPFFGPTRREPAERAPARQNRCACVDAAETRWRPTWVRVRMM